MNTSTKLFSSFKKSFALGRLLTQGFFLTCFLAVFIQTLHGDEFSSVTVDNDLSVGGNSTIHGYLAVSVDLATIPDTDGIYLGDFYPSSGVLPLLKIQGHDNGDAVSSVVSFIGYSQYAAWNWIQNGSSSQMSLSNGTLEIYDGSGNLAFNASNSTLTINGTTTLNLAGLGGTFVTVPGDGGFYPGNGATATGYRSAAIGGNGTAAGGSSVALANGTTNGNFSLASGNLSIANGTNSVALSGGNVGANGTAALAAGSGSFANSTGAIALGNGTTSQAWSSVTVGHYNSNITGNNTVWVSTDPVFIVGTGNSTTRANGIVIYNSGNITMPKRQGDIIMGAFGNGGGD